MTFLFFLSDVQATEEFQEVQDIKVCWNSVRLPEGYFLYLSDIFLSVLWFQVNLVMEVSEGPKVSAGSWSEPGCFEADDFALADTFRGVLSSSFGAIFLGDTGLVGAPGPAGEKGAKGSTGESQF